MKKVGWRWDRVGDALTMKISGRKPISSATPITGPVRVGRQERAEPAPPVAPAADVEISVSTREVDRARQILAVIPDVRIERVEEIKPSVDDGSYRVESKVLAKKMVNTSLRESAQARTSKKN